MKKVSVVLAAMLSLGSPSTIITAPAAGAANPPAHAYTSVTGHQRSVVSLPDICSRMDAEGLCASAGDGSRRGATGQRVPHQRAAEELIDHLNAIGWPQERKYNRYRQGQEETIVRWGQPGRPDTYKNVSQCASFVTETLKHTYSHWATLSFFHTHFGNYSPFARDYHDAIANKKPIPHFRRVTKVTDLRPGDLIAIKYPESQDFTGHVMLVRRVTGREQTGPALDDATAYVVEIIDTTKAAHGRVGQSGAYRDTRITASTEETGAGYGHMVFYANNKERTFAGYRWSVTSHQIVPVDKHPIVAARITP
ncbi:hypothetical protein JOF56_009497 [Kibdelosporangium banguiense]|uniref:CHAP domain-containing protein n=1 Tax=Kibdelosporangium banguiense TaxID=1365924 RepID=A0ABS4TXH9_9PSEU|nr:hypothetical protein [Kibdelosporangium banguiense]MBP2329112.1 hypothetical protein [Kibdelosporangium banguiense]